MDDDFLYSIAFPGNIFNEVLEDLVIFGNVELNDRSIRVRNAIEFHLDFIGQLAKLNEYQDSIINKIYGENINLIKPHTLAEYFFSESTAHAIIDFLNKYDNVYFWDAFGISLETGNIFLEKIKNQDEHPSVFEEIRNAIINSGKLKKEIVVTELSSIILNNLFIKNSSRDMADFFFRIFDVTRRYPTIREALKLSDDIEYKNSSTLCRLFTAFEECEKDEITPRLLFEISKAANICGCISEVCEHIDNVLLNEENTSYKCLLNLFKVHRCGYDAYLMYLEYCNLAKFEPTLKVGNSPELYFYNSYKVPQLPSLYKRYFDGVSEEKAKEKTEKCFKKIYVGLNKKGFLDNDCINEFLWAFGLTDKYPYRFKKIAFHTSKEKKANGAFLTLLKILGYEEDEIKEMRMERKNKPNLINQIFDLTLSRKTKESKDYHDLLEIVKSSGLPVNG